MIIHIKVTPNASNNQMVKWEEDVLSIRIKGVPEKGQVNEELIAFLAKAYSVSKSQIKIISGQTSRLKRLEIVGLSQEKFYEVLQKLSKK